MKTLTYICIVITNNHGSRNKQYQNKQREI